jgi:hypothetical protein
MTSYKKMSLPELAHEIKIFTDALKVLTDELEGRMK